jgi:hypothetical protein
VVNNSNSTLGIFDVSNPASPQSVGSVSAGASSGPVAGYVQGRYAYILTNNSSSLVIFDLGGAYIQQLQAGGIESTTLATTGNAAIGNDLDVKGGLTVGSSANFSGTVAIAAAPSSTATGSSLQFGSTLASGSSNGTYIGINPASFTGNFADFQVAGSSKLSVDSTGAITFNSGISGVGKIYNNTGAGYISLGTYNQDTLKVSAGYASINSNADGGVGLSIGGPSAGSIGIRILQVAGGSGDLLQLTASNSVPLSRFDGSGNLLVSHAPAASANLGNINSGSGPFDGTTGSFVGNSAANGGTQYAANAATNFVGNFVDYQIQGSSKFAINYQGNTTIAGTLTTTGQIIANGGITAPVGSNQSEAFGGNINSASTQYSLAVGYGANIANGFGSEAIGRSSTSNGNYSLAVGDGASSIGYNSIALGKNTSATGLGSIAIGASMAAGDHQVVIGGPNNVAINDVFIGDGVTNVLPSNLSINSTGSSATGIAGASITINGGAANAGDATSYGGAVILQTQTNGTTALTDRLHILAAGQVGVNTVNPQYQLDVTGDINTSATLKIAGTTICSVSGCTASSGSGSYIQNGTSLQASSNFNISGNGLVGGTLGVTGLINATGGISSPGSGTYTERFGNSATTGAGASSLAVGASASAQADDATAIGKGASVNYNLGVAVGSGATVSGLYGVAVGAGTNAGTLGVAIGIQSNASLGGIALGYGATTTSGTQLVIGGTGAIQDAYIGNGVTSSTPLPITLHATGASGVGTAGASFNIQGGTGSSNATPGIGGNLALNGGIGGSAAVAGGDILFQTAAAGAGTTLVDRLHITAAGNIGIGTSSPSAQLVVAGQVPNGTLGSISTGASSTPNSVYVQGRYAYVANRGINTLGIYDISSPASPVAIGSVSTGASSTPYSVYVQGRYAYVANSGNSTLGIYNISNPSSPTAVGSISTGASSNPQSVYVSGSYAYVANTNTDTLGIYDISNPASPRAAGSVSTGASSGPIKVYVQGRYAYVANYANSTMGIFDVSNPASPTSVSSVNAGGPNATAVAVQGRYAYVADYSYQYLKVMDISNPASPVTVGSVACGGIPSEVTVNGNYAYVTTQSPDALKVIDISNPASPTSVGSVSTGASSLPVSLYVQGRYAYVANYTSNTLVTFDLGGAYIQQLRVGGIESTTLATIGNATIGNDLDVKGGLVVGSSANFTSTVGVSGLINANGGITSSLGLANSEFFGNGATFCTITNCPSGVTNATALGNGSIVANQGVSIGTNAGIYSNIAEGQGGTAIGFGAIAGYGGVAIGHGAHNSASVTDGGVAVGTGASAGRGVAVGASSSADDNGSVSVGQNAVSTYAGTAIGGSTSVTGFGGIALGTGAVAGANQLVIGSGSAYSSIQQVVVGNGLTSATPSGFTLQGTSGTGTNISGATVTLAGGVGTGSGAGGEIVLQTASSGTSGATAGTLADRLHITASGNVGIGTSLPTAALQVSKTVVATGNYGTFSVGSGAFDGTTSGYYQGSSSGTVVAVNAAAAFAGNLMDLQVNGASQFKVGATGAVTVSSAPTTSATASLVQLGAAIVGGDASTNGGTYVGVNAASAFVGDFANYQVNGTSKYKLSYAGDLTTAGNLTINGAGTSTFAGNLTVTGTVTTSTLTSTGILALSSAASSNITLTPGTSGFVLIGSATNNTQIDTNGGITFNGAARPYSELDLLPQDAVLPASSGCTAGSVDDATNLWTYKTIDCAYNTATQYATWQFKMPSNYVNGSNVQADVYWTDTAGASTTTGAEFDTAYLSTSTGSSFSGALTSVPGSVVLSSGQKKTTDSTITLTSPSINADDTVAFRITRPNTDTLVDTARIIHVRIRFLVGS